MLYLKLSDGVAIHSAEDPLTVLVLGVAEGKVSKAEVAVFLARHAKAQRG